MTRRFVGLSLTLPFLGVLSCSDDATTAITADVSADMATADADPADAPSDDVAIEVVATVTGAPAVAEAGAAISLQVETVPPTSGLAVTATVNAGGGTVPPAAMTTDGDGRSALQWTLGALPIPQRLTVEVGGVVHLVEVDATLDTPLSSTAFGDVATYFEAEVLEGSTEDLVFARDALVLGAPGGLLAVDAAGAVSRVVLSGEVPARGWGVASHPDGTLWVVDSAAQRLTRVDTAGVVKSVLSADGADAFNGLNDVEVGPDGRVYASDPCLGRVVRVNVDTDQQDGSLGFDRAKQGGPNGMAFDSAGRLYVSTENTVLLCGQDVAAYDAPLAGVYRADVSGDGFGALEPIQEGLGVFGDGMAFDRDGNLYVIIDTVNGVAIGESAVWVLPGGDGPARKAVVAPPGILYANLAFGRGDFGPTSLYLCLLSAAPLTGPESLGLHRLEVGVEGAPR
ncbi:MAG: SMP-30/gluconolactonase/LRE family protein [Myxococcales bacterium]|nr:SMP-30/gluconolactonase/LRE family protein [Myxococcales bacterium]